MSKPTPEEFDVWTDKFFDSDDDEAFLNEIDSYKDEEWQEEMSSFLLGIFQTPENPRSPKDKSKK